MCSSENDCQSVILCNQVEDCAASKFDESPYFCGKEHITSFILSQNRKRESNKTKQAIHRSLFPEKLHSMISVSGCPEKHSSYYCGERVSLCLSPDEICDGSPNCPNGTDEHVCNSEYMGMCICIILCGISNTVLILAD